MSQHRNKNFKARYGITLDEYQQMFEDREGKCDACGDQREFDPPLKTDRLYIDHCHKDMAAGVKRVRGLLCQHCNFIAGRAFDQPTRIASVLAYLNRDLYRDETI